MIVLNEGRIHQIGTPSDVYDRPRNLFVARFIGSPEMNLLEGKVGERDTAVFKGRGISLRLQSTLPPGPLTLGIRPEDLSLTAGEGLEEIARGEIALVENLGPEAISHLDLNGERLVIRSKPSPEIREGEERTVYARPGKIHCFRYGLRVG